MAFDELLDVLKMSAMLQIDELTFVCANWLKIALNSDPDKCIILMIISKRYQLCE